MRKGTSTILLLVLLAAPAAHATDAVFPSIPHDRWDVIPFANRSGTGRFQQIYAAEQFPGPIAISAISYSMLQFANYSANIEIKIGHTTKAVSTLALPLANNVTSPLTTVFQDADYQHVVASGSEAFGLAFDFSGAPFVYDPTSGESLLIDITISDKNDGTPSDETGVSMIPSIPSTLTARGYEMTGFEGINQWGARTRLTFTAVVPEPSTLALFAIGCAAIGYRRRC